MNRELPFDSIESAHEFVALLAKVALETKGDIDADIQREMSPNASRRLEALQIVAYKLEVLGLHLTKSRRILNDLRSLRRLLFEERSTSVSVVRRKSPAMAKPESTPPPEGSRLGASPESAAAGKAGICAAVRKRALSTARDPHAINQEATDPAPWYNRPEFKATGPKHKAAGVL